MVTQIHSPVEVEAQDQVEAQGQIEATRMPEVQIVTPNVTRFVDIRDFVREGEDLATMADSDVIGRASELVGESLGTGYKVTRPATGNILVSRQAVFG